MLIGFIGQGWIGKHYADDFETRGYQTVRYALEAPYSANKAQLVDCQIVFVAVPTPTTPDGFSYQAVSEALTAVASGTTVVIKSTLLPGTTRSLQASFPLLTVMHSPEFLVEQTAAHDAAHPQRNIIGIVFDTPSVRERAKSVCAVLPIAPFEAIMLAEEAELVKYAGNCFLMTKVLFMNMFYDYTLAHGGSWEHVRDALIADPRIGNTHTNPVHQNGRGAGGHCFIKDFEAWRRDYEVLLGDAAGSSVLSAMVKKNNDLLTQSGKDADIVRGVYGV